MIIIIDNFAVSIDRQNKQFKFHTEAEVRLVSPNKVTAIHICKPCNISTPAIMLASENNIPILIFNNKGRVVSRLWTPGYGSLSIIRHHQLYFAHSAEGMAWAAKCLLLKTENQLSVLKYCKNRVQAAAAEMDSAISILEKGKEGFEKAPFTETGLRAIEAQNGLRYWKAIAIVMQNYSPFGKRTRQPAEDKFNALINYGYGMLYAIVETATITAGLDADAGILHAEGYNRPSFVFDAIEPFRQWIDRLVVDMALKNEIEETFFEPDKEEKGIFLATTGKKVYIPRVNDMMQEATLFNGRRIKRKDQIQHLMTTLAQFLLKEWSGLRSQ